jgi:hypothetical protein
MVGGSCRADFGSDLFGFWILDSFEENAAGTSSTNSSVDLLSGEKGCVARQDKHGQ